MAVAYDASGANQGTAGVTSFSQAFTAAAGADVYLGVTAASSSFPTLGVPTYGGSAMTLVKSINPSASGTVALYRLAGGGTGSSLAFGGSLNVSSWVSLEWASYLGVSSVGTPTFANSSGTSPSTGSITLTTGQMALAYIAGADLVTQTISSPTGGTNRQSGSTSTPYCGAALSDSTSTATFGATFGGAKAYATIAVVMSPASGTTVAPTTSTVAITGGTPTVSVSGNVSVSPASATISIAGGTSVVSISGTVVAIPTTATIAITGGTPTVSVSGNVSVSPASATISIAGGTSQIIQRPFDVVLSKLGAGISSAILCVGDSTVYGYNDASQATLFGWTGRLGVALAGYFNANAQVMTGSASPNSWATASSIFTSTLGGSAPTINILNAGVDGATISSLTTFEGDFFSSPASGSVVDLIFIQDGFNETLPAGLGAQYLTFVEFAQSKLPGVPIIITTENNATVTSEAFGDSPPFATIFGDLITEFLPGQSLPLSPVVQKSSAAPLTWVIDSQQANIPAANITNAGIHPDGTGYGIYANYLLSQLAPATVGTLQGTSPATIAITGGTPTVSVSGNVSVSPATATVHVTGSTPTVTATANVVVSPATATITITGGTPVVVAGVFAAPATATVHITGGTSVITGLATIITPAHATITITGGRPVVAVSGFTLHTPARRTTQVPAQGRSVTVLPNVRTTVVPASA